MEITIDKRTFTDARQAQQHIMAIAVAGEPHGRVQREDVRAFAEKFTFDEMAADAWGWLTEQFEFTDAELAEAGITRQTLAEEADRFIHENWG